MNATLFQVGKKGVLTELVKDQFHGLVPSSRVNQDIVQVSDREDIELFGPKYY